MVVISKYTDRHDFGDTVEIFGVEKILSKYQIYLYNSIVPLKMESKRELLPFYPYLIGMMYSNREEGGVIRLSSESYIDTQEKEWLGWTLRDAQKYWRQCKRKKIPFDVDECLKKISFFEPRDYDRQIVEQVKEFGKKATIDGIHTQYHDRCREKLYEDMIASGWEDSAAYPWCFGWDRYFKRGVST